MNFVTQEQLEESKRNRGERLEDGTAQRDRPLFEILKENKDKRDAEFDDRFKHRPPKALDEDETEFLDSVELSRKQYERQIALEEAQQLRTFQAAVEAQSLIVHESKETPHVSAVQVVVQTRLETVVLEGDKSTLHIYSSGFSGPQIRAFRTVLYISLLQELSEGPQICISGGSIRPLNSLHFQLIPIFKILFT